MKLKNKLREEREESVRETPALVAKKAHTIRFNDYLRVIVEGEDISDVPAFFHENLRTEGVI